jgi:hypothetical protein
VVAELETLTGGETRRIHVDKGYRGHNHVQKFRVWITGQVRRVTASIRREMRRRAAVKPVIGDTKADHRLGRNYLKGRLEGGPGCAAVDDDPGGGSDYCHRNHGTCAGGREFPSRTRFRGLARADASPEIVGRKAEARRHFETRRADHPPLADPRGQRGDPAGLSARGAGRVLAGSDATPQAEDVGYRRLGQQDGSRRLRWRLQSSGHGSVS